MTRNETIRPEPKGSSKIAASESPFGELGERRAEALAQRLSDPCEKLLEAPIG
jgi:hypothetical protein